MIRRRPKPTDAHALKIALADARVAETKARLDYRWLNENAGFSLVDEWNHAIDAAADAANRRLRGAFDQPTIADDVVRQIRNLRRRYPR